MKTSGISPGFLFDRLSCRCRSRQPLLQVGLTSQLPDRGKDYRTARRACSSRAMRCLHTQAPPDTEPCVVCTDSFQHSVAQNGVPRDRSRGRQGFCQLSDRSTEAVACGRTPHVRAQQIWGQAACSATRLLVIFGFQETLVKACESGIRQH